MTIQELHNIFNGQVPDEPHHLFNEMKRLADSGLKPTIKSCLTASGKRYYYVASDTTYMFDPPCAAVSIKVKIGNHVWYIYYRHGNAWLKRDRDWFASHVANRPLDHLEPLSTADELRNWVWSQCSKGLVFNAVGTTIWRLVQDACYRLFEADKVEDPKEEPKPNKDRKPREPREPREQRKPRLSKKDVGPELHLDF